MTATGLLLDHVREVLVRGRRVIGELHGVLDLDADVILECVQLGLGEADVEQTLAAAVERIAPLPLLDLVLGAVEARITHRVTAEPVGHDLDECGLAGGARSLDRLGDPALDLDDIVAIEPVARHAMADRAERDILDGERAIDRRAHRVLVVLADQHHGQLPQRRERQPSAKPPIVDAPSPKKHSVTRPSPRYFDANAAPAAIGTWPPTMP